MSKVIISKSMGIEEKDLKYANLIWSCVSLLLRILEGDNTQGVESGTDVSALIDIVETWKGGEQYLNVRLREYRNKTLLYENSSYYVPVKKILSRVGLVEQRLYLLIDYIVDVHGIEPTAMRVRMLEGHKINWFVVE